MVVLARFDMSFVEDLEIGMKDPMKYVIMNPDKRALIEAAAGSPRQGTALKPWTTDWSAEFIEGKGRGRVIFLHGTFLRVAFSSQSPFAEEAENGRMLTRDIQTDRSTGDGKDPDGRANRQEDKAAPGASLGSGPWHRRGPVGEAPDEVARPRHHLGFHRAHRRGRSLSRATGGRAYQSQCSRHGLVLSLGTLNVGMGFHRSSNV